jgi:YVTN family beta-propeller protein
VLGVLALAVALLPPVHARLVPPAEGVTAGQQVTAAIVTTRPVRTAPRVRFTLEGSVVSATGRRITARRYSLRFVLPRGGSWAYRISVGRIVAGSGRVVARVDSHLPGAEASAICADAGDFWPTMTLAIDFGSKWIACKGRGLLLRQEPAAQLMLGGSSLIAVTSGFGSVWALDGSRSGTLVRIDPATNAVSARISVETAGAYNVWAGAGAIWVAGDQSAEVVRIDPATNRVTAHIPVGDGPADLVFRDTSAWVIDHRDGTFFRIDAGIPRRLATIPGDAPERMVFAAGHIWITGRGSDLLEVDPETGAVLRTVEIGAGGIDVAASGDTLWVPARNADSDQRGFPTMEALRRVDARTGAVVSSLRAQGRLDVHGLVADEREVWLADNTHGVLYRVPA